MPSTKDLLSAGIGVLLGFFLYNSVKDVLP